LLFVSLAHSVCSEWLELIRYGIWLLLTHVGPTPQLMAIPTCAWRGMNLAPCMHAVHRLFGSHIRQQLGIAVLTIVHAYTRVIPQPWRQLQEQLGIAAAARVAWSF
jgi:hypothetical protein